VDRDLAAPPSAGSVWSRLDAWLADAKVDGAAEARVRERWLQAASEGDGALAAVLLDLAERRTPVALHGTGGRPHHGTVRVVGADFVALRTAREDVLIRLATITSVRPADAVGTGAGSGRGIVTDVGLLDVLARLAEERAPVVVVTAGAHDVVTGDLTIVGIDVIALRGDRNAGATAYVPGAAIAEVVVR
jgi:hypothetical protein